MKSASGQEWTYPYPWHCPCLWDFGTTMYRVPSHDRVILQRIEKIGNTQKMLHPSYLYIITLTLIAHLLLPPLWDYWQECANQQVLREGNTRERIIKSNLRDTNLKQYQSSRYHKYINTAVQLYHRYTTSSKLANYRSLKLRTSSESAWRNDAPWTQKFD